MSQYKQKYIIDKACPFCGSPMIQLRAGISPYCSKLGCSNKPKFVNEMELMHHNAEIARAMGYEVQIDRYGGEVWAHPGDNYPDGGRRMLAFGGNAKSFNESFAKWMKEIEEEEYYANVSEKDIAWG